MLTVVTVTHDSRAWLFCDGKEVIPANLTPPQARALARGFLTALNLLAPDRPVRFGTVRLSGRREIVSRPPEEIIRWLAANQWDTVTRWVSERSGWGDRP